MSKTFNFGKLLKILIAVLTALAGSLGLVWSFQARQLAAAIVPTQAA